MQRDMASSGIRAGRARNCGFGMRRLIRRARLAWIFGWFAFWLAPIGHANCAVRVIRTGPGEVIAQISNTGLAPAPQNSPPNSDDPDQCQQLLEQVLDAGSVPQPAVALPVADDEPASLALPPAAQLLIMWADDRLARNRPFHPLPPPDRTLYLRTLRLLI